MKIFKFLAMLTISVLLFTGCEKEEITNYAFQEISAPTNVTANFSVAQDDSGDVTITPSGEGAQVFKVYFGDGDDTPVEVAQGESVTYTYGEGEYLVRVVAVGSTGLTSEFNQRLLISFKAPENLVVNVDQSASNPAMVSVSATADFAATFDVYFGDVEDEEPTQLMPDGSINHTYASPGTYTIRVVAKGAGAATTEATEEVVVPEANDPVKLPITYDLPTVNYALGTFNGATFKVVTNPFLSGANPEESMVGAITNAGANFEGGAYNLGEPVDFSGDNKTITMKFYSDKPVSVLVKFEGGATDADRANEVSVDHGGTGWEVLTFDFGTDALKSFIEGDPGNFTPFVPTGKYSTLVLFVEIGKTTKGTFYFDDIMKAGDGPVASTKTSFPVNFETAANGGATANWSVFENVDNPPLEIVSNPNATGANTSATVAKFIARQGGQPFAGTITQLQTPFTLSASNSIVKILVWKTVISDVGIKFENATGGSTGEVKVANTKVNEWEELTFDFSSAIGKPENTNITGLVVFPDFKNGRSQDNVVYFDNITLNAAGSGGGGTTGADFGLPIDFDASTTYTTGANSVPFKVVTNPKQSGINPTATKVGEVTNNGGQYEALSFVLDKAIDFSGSNKTITMKVYSETAYPVLFKFETGVNGERANQVQANHTGSGWEELTFNFATDAKTSYNSDADPGGAAFVPTGKYKEIAIFLDFAGFTAGTFYIDDIEQN